MRKQLIAVLALAAVFLAGCERTIDYSGADRFLKSFIHTIQAGTAERYGDYYIQDADFSETEEADLASKRFLGTVREQFLANCESAHNLLRGQDIDIVSIDKKPGKALAASFLRDVTENYTDVEMRIKTGEFEVVLRFRELIHTGAQWRLTTFTMTVDTGAEELEPIEIPVEVPEE